MCAVRDDWITPGTQCGAGADRTVARAIRAILVTSLLTLTWPPGIAVAQEQEPGSATVRGVVVGATAGESVAHTLVILVDSDGERVDAALSGAGGEYLLEAPHPGTYRVRAERIGYESITSPPLMIDAGSSLYYRIVAPVREIELEALEVAVEDDRNCVEDPRDASVTARLWDEARKALRVTDLTQRNARYWYELTRYERELDPDNLRVLEEQTHVVSGFSNDPHVAVSPSRLADVGFAALEGRDVVYYGPDAEVLLSDAFLDRHCFRIRAGGDERPALIGLAFEPTEDSGRPDIEGTLWLDRSNSMLRYLEFRYTDLPFPRPLEGARGHAGGRVEFERMPNGRWIVSRWRLRMPIVAMQRISGLIGGGYERYIMAGLREEGGAVTGVFTAAGERVARGQPAGCW